MKADQVLTRLKALSDERLYQLNLRNGAGKNQFGIKMGDLRVIAKEIKTDSALAKELWATGNFEARLVAVLIVKPTELSAEELEAWVKSIPFDISRDYSQLADWVNSYVVKTHPEKEKLRLKWADSKDVMLSRSFWSLTTERVEKNPEGLDLAGLLDRIEQELPKAPAPVQWTMNGTLAEIGISHPSFRERALAIGEKLGVYRDFPTPKGCTSPFAPIWITELVKRQANAR